MGDIPRRAHVTHRACGVTRADHLRGIAELAGYLLIDQRAVHGTRQHRIGANSVRRAVHRERPRQVVYAGLGCAIGKYGCWLILHRGGRGDVDDRTARLTDHVR